MFYVYMLWTFYVLCGYTTAMIPFLGDVQVLLCEISRVCCLKGLYSSFSSYFFFVVIFVLLMLVLLRLFLVAVIRLSLLILCRLQFILSMHQRYLASPLLFLTHIASLCHLWDVRPYLASTVFLFSGSFWGSSSFVHFEMVPSILQGAQPKFLSRWWYFWNVDWLRVVFSSSWDTPCNFF